MLPGEMCSVRSVADNDGTRSLRQPAIMCSQCADFGGIACGHPKCERLVDLPGKVLNWLLKRKAVKCQEHLEAAMVGPEVASPRVTFRTASTNQVPGVPRSRREPVPASTEIRRDTEARRVRLEAERELMRQLQQSSSILGGTGSPFIVERETPLGGPTWVNFTPEGSEE